MTNPVYGQQSLNSTSSEFNVLTFVMQQALAKLNVATLVQVVNAYPGGVGAVGTVDIVVLVSQVAGDGTAVPHTTIYNIPYLRLQAGASAIILDPLPGDIGFAVFADRDLSVAQASIEAGTPSSSLPGSGRRFDMADALYLGGWCGNVVPTNYVQINSTEAQLVFGSNSITITSSGIQINGNVSVQGSITSSGNMTAAGIDLDTHTHQVTGIQTGGSTVNTGGPQG